MKLIQAQAIARTYAVKLHPFSETERLYIAGSIRRRKNEVGDIEIVCLPRTESVATDLFAEEKKTILIQGFAETVNSFGKVLKGEPTGRNMKIQLPEGIVLDLYMPQAHDYFRQLAIRTGSAKYAAEKIAGSWVKLGWCGTKDGLRRIDECTGKPYETGGKTKTIWTCRFTHPTLPPEWKTEREFFEWLGVLYVEPMDREI
jgi:DNA polymerase/3'-5' exonuclease PolX